MQNLTNEELKLVIEALLFTGTVQVFSEHTDAEAKQMVEIAKKLNVGVEPELSGVYFLVQSKYEESYVSDIPAAFPKLPQVGIKDVLG
jgi:hypothetical protein